ncbi:MAG: hypothetical protein J5716_06685 [Alphaproteobacteria bacterium]|nr:hypothetical protein [Alphaproteobacteria bacterium]
MKKNLLATVLIGLFFLGAPKASAQMFYNARSDFDKTGSTAYRATAEKTPKEGDSEVPAPFEVIVSAGIRERIRSDAAYIIGEPDETICYGIARKSPKKRSETIDGYAHIGNCGTLNETGMSEIQEKLFNELSYDMKISKIASCVTTPKIALRFRKGFDFVDVILAGGNCPAVYFLYGGETREFSAKPIKEWLDTFIEAVSGDLEPLNPEIMERAAANMFRKRSSKDDNPPEAKPAQEAPKMWGRRRAIRPAEPEPEAQPDSSVPPPPR